MNTLTKIILSISIIAVWIVSMCFFVPYDLKIIEMPDNEPNQFFDKSDNFNIDYYFGKHIDDTENVLRELSSADYRCLSSDETYDILVNKSKNPVDVLTINVTTDYISYSYKFDNGHIPDSVSFFTLDSKNYILFTSVTYREQKLRFIGHSYAIYETDEFSENISSQLRSSANIISKPVENSTVEAIVQSSVTAVIYGVTAFFIITTILYKQAKKRKKLSDDETTTDGDIKKYIKHKLGAEFFNEEKVFTMPCLTLDAYGEKAKEFICLIAENLNTNEIFIGGFFEKKCFFDEESENVIFIKEYLDENSYSSINPVKNAAVIKWIIDGNNNGETSISFYIQELNILIYPAKNKLYIFSKDSRNVYNRLISFINPTDYNLRF